MPGLLAAEKISDIAQHSNHHDNDFTFESLNCSDGRSHDESSNDLHTEIHHTLRADHNGLTQKKLSNLKEDEEDISAFLLSLQSLLSKYSIYNSSKAPASPVSSGGIQQLLTRKLGKKTDHDNDDFSFMQKIKSFYFKDCSTVKFNESTNEGDGNIIQFLPVDMKLHIFSYLDARSLCLACCVSQEWNLLGSHDLLWKKLLHQDSKHWTQISHTTNPQMYQEVSSDWSQKEIYLKCSPEVHKQLHHPNTTFHNVTSMFKYLMPKKVPKVAMFGPGLEQSTSSIVRQMLYENNSTFTRVAMFPGQFDGVGGGMTLKLQTGHSLHLSVLYSASKNERENRNAQERVDKNKMFQKQLEGEESNYELKTQIKHFCQILDGFIFVVDASETKESVASARHELMAMIKERRTAPHVPVLILSCVKNDERSGLPVRDIVELLNLSTISQPWMVINCVSETLKSVDTGIIWLIDQSQFR
ncbi:F-box only protein 4-like [Physella acuta]|uniref:F-box only protein 4-like n=1 Tax=Physella acuta TaxID=109671 RepID=UPI0027DCD573|nr:F-box only protein 4-like [Physella acuta]